MAVAASATARQLRLIRHHLQVTGSSAISSNRRSSQHARILGSQKQRNRRNQTQHVYPRRVAGAGALDEHHVFRLGVIRGAQNLALGRAGSGTEALELQTIEHVFNLTGTVLHTNLGRALVGTRVFGIRGSVSVQSHTHEFGDARERDRHATGFIEASITGVNGRHTWVAGGAWQADAYRGRDITRFDYTYQVPSLFAQDDITLSRAVAVSVSEILSLAVIRSAETRTVGAESLSRTVSLTETSR